MDKQTVNYYLGKPLVTLEGEILGTISNVRFSDKMVKLKYLEAFGADEENFFVDVKRVFNAGENAIILKTCGTVCESAAGCSPLNLPVYTAEGEFIGVCSDVSLNAYDCNSLLIDGKVAVACSQIVTVGSNAVIVNPEGKKLPLKKKTKPDNTVLAREKVENVKEQFDVSAPAQEPSALRLPDSVIANNKLLIGRKVQKDIYNQRGEIIIRKSNIITAYTLETAKKYGKLFELTVNSLSNIIN